MLPHENNSRQPLCTLTVVCQSNRGQQNPSITALAIHPQCGAALNEAPQRTYYDPVALVPADFWANTPFSLISWPPTQAAPVSGIMVNRQRIQVFELKQCSHSNRLFPEVSLQSSYLFYLKYPHSFIFTMTLNVSFGCIRGVLTRHGLQYAHTVKLTLVNHQPVLYCSQDQI